MYALLEKCSSIITHLYNARVIKDFFIYSFGSLLVRAASLFLVPFIMRVLSPADYGALSLVTACITIGTALLGLGLRQALSLEYFHHNEPEQKKVISEILALYTFVALPVLYIVWHFQEGIRLYIFFNAITIATFAVMLGSLFLFFYTELLYQLLQYQRKVQLLTLIQIAITCITLSTTYYAVWILRLGIMGVVLGQAVGHVCATLLALSYFARMNMQHHLNFKALSDNLTSYLKVGVPFIPGIICSWILASSDRWMLGHYYSMKEVGIYSVADLFAQIFNAVVLVPWSGSYLPYILTRYKEHLAKLELIEKENKRTMWITLTVLLVCIFIGLAIFQPVLRMILPPSYHPSLNYVGLLLTGQVFLLGSYFASTILQFQKRSFLLATALAIPALSNLCLNYLLIAPYGIYGSALATCLSYGLYFALVLQLSA